MSINLINQSFINRNIDFINNIQEQGFSTFEKVNSFSKSYMASYLSKALIASVALSYLGFSFSTAFPTCLVLIAFASFTGFALKSIQEALNTLAEKGKECLTRIVQLISDIFKIICVFISSFALQTTHCTFSLISNKKLPINSLIPETKPLIIEQTPQIQANNYSLVAVLQKRIPEITKKAKKSEILSKFEQLCIPSESINTFNYPSLRYPFPQRFQSQPSQLLPIDRIPPKAASFEPDKNLKSQRLIPVPLPSIKFGMKVLNLAKMIK